MNKISNLILKSFNLLFIFHTSIDSNYDTIDDSSLGNANSGIRYSLLYIPLGKRIFYFVTFNNLKKFNLIKCLHFNKIQNKKSAEVIENLVTNYKQNHLMINPKLKIAQQEEFLKIRLNENNASIQSIQSKASYFLAILLALIGTITYLCNEVIKQDTNILFNMTSYYFICGFILYTYNSFLFSIYIIKVNSFYVSSFKDLRNNDSDYALTESIYRDWISSNESLSFFAGLLKNSFKYLILSFLYMIFSIFFILIIPNFMNDTYTKVESHIVFNIKEIKQ